MHLSIIDAIRGLAALLVALDHGLLPRELPIPFDAELLLLAKVVISGPAAVLVFFVVSGFCIHAPNVGRELDVKSFVIRRVVRLGLPFLLATCLAYAVGYRWFSLPFGEPAIWSLACEIVYYWMYIYIQPIIKTNRQWLVTIISLFAFALVLGYFGREVLDYPGRNFIVLTMMGLPIWLSGCYLAQLTRNGFAFQFSPFMKALLWLGVIFGGGVAAVLKVKFNISYAITLTFYGCLIAPWMWVVLSKRIDNSFVKLLGDASYSIYLLHQPLVPFVRGRLASAASECPYWVIDFLTLGIVLGVAIIFYYLVERSSHRMARWLSTRAKTTKLVV